MFEHNSADKKRGQQARKQGQPRDPNTLAMSPDAKRAWLRGWDSVRATYINPSPDQPGHACARDERGNRLDTLSGPRATMVACYQRAGYDVRDEQGRWIDLHDLIKSEAQGAEFGLIYDWCGQRWVEA